MTDDPLGQSLTALAQVPVPLTWDDVERHVRTPAPPPPHRRRRRLLAAAAMVVVAALAVGAFLLWPRAEPGSVTTISEPPADGSTTTTSPATRTSRSFPVTAVAGDRYLVWGGEAGANDVSARADGFAVDLESGSVSPIPVAPIDPRSGAAGVWTGSELIVCCGIGQADGFPFDTRSAAAWDPASGEWRALPPPPEGIARAYAAAVWTGEVMVVVAPEGAAATYDPEAGEWVEIPAPPVPAGCVPEAVWTGDEMVAWNPVFGSGRVPPDGAVADQGWRWAPGDPAWTPLPDLPEGARTSRGSMGWTGIEVVVWGESTAQDGMGVGARWRPGDDAWRPLPPSPQGPVEHYDGTAGSQSVVSDPDGGRVLVVGLDPAHGGPSPIYAYDPTTDRWTDTGVTVVGYHPRLDVAGDRLLTPDEAAPVVGRI